MKALSLWQPWASLVVLGAKRFETRSWSTTYRGPLAIHASKVWNEGLAEVCRTVPFQDALRPLVGAREAARVLYHSFLEGPDGPWLPFGALLGTVTLVDVRPNIALVPELSARELAFGLWAPGRFAWQLEGPEPLREPLPYSGAQGLFDVPDSLLGVPA